MIQTRKRTKNSTPRLVLAECCSYVLDVRPAKADIQRRFLTQYSLSRFGRPCKTADVVVSSVCRHKTGLFLFVNNLQAGGILIRIQQKRIQNSQHYLYAFSPEDGLYITVPVLPEMADDLLAYGFRNDGIARIPMPRRAATTANASGRWKVRKDLPKEPREIEHEYHIVDWHGDDHYGTCWQTRMCYQRELIPPSELAFKVENDVLYSPMFHNSAGDMANIKVAINVLLEIFGFCELWTAEKAPAIPPVKQEEVPWEILRKGTRERADWEEYIDKITRVRPQQQRAIIKQRHEHLWKQQPDFCVLGTQNFWGYVVYGFSNLNLFVFECNQPNNATYVFRGNWEAASKLTKTEILDGHLQEARLLHTEKWYENVRVVITRHNKEVA